MSAYLFDPDEVDKLLRGLPSLRAALPAPPAAEGDPADHFPNARKSRRQLYRILGNVHYEHLDALVGSLDKCVERGYRQPALWRTRGLSTFRSTLAELGVAEHLLLREFRVEGLDEAKSQEPVPDLLATQGSYAVAVEVYLPREREGFDDLVDELKDELKNLDIPLDYRFDVRVEPLDPSLSRLAHPVLLEPESRRKLADAVMSQVRTSLSAERAAVIDLPLSREGVRVQVNVDDVRPSSGRLPDRAGQLSPTSRAWPEPTSVFADVVDRVINKLSEQQAPGSGQGANSAMVVDLWAMESLTPHLSDPSRQESYRLDAERMEAKLNGYDVVAFCDGWEWEHQHPVWATVTSSALPEGLLSALFD